MIRAHRLVAAAIVLLLLAGACSDDDGAAAPTTTVAVDADPGGFVPAPIEWEACGNLECATLEVPVDYAEPSGDRTSVYVSRIPASGDRIGPLFFHPGGPGASPAAYLPGIALLLPEVAERFDLIGIEPRGAPGSGALDCGMSVEELYRPDPTIDSPADRDALLSVSAAYTSGCERAFGVERLRHLGTREAARDLDSVRAAMGDGQVSFLGVSYGTAVGQVYGQLFPARVRSMLLDGVVELGTPGLEDARQQAEGFELALRNWAAACAADDDCPVEGDPIAAVEAVQAMAEQGEGIPAPGSGRSAGPSEVSLALGHGLYDPALWDQFGGAVDDALDGDGDAMVTMADAYLAGSDYDVYFAVNCIDFAWPTDPDEVLAAGKASLETAPHFGEAWITDYIRCATWPVPADPLEASPLPGLPTVLVISTTGDPATPYEAGVRLAEQLADAVLVTHEGEGHGVVASGDACIDEITTAYLIEQRSPRPGTVCAD